MDKENAVLQGNSAQACLKLQLYNDAFKHSCKCIKLDHQNYNGYFQRAEALKLMLETSETCYGTHVNLVEDYLKCHSLQSNEEAFSKAIIIAVEHGKSTN